MLTGLFAAILALSARAGPVHDTLVSRGLTRREAISVEARHRRRSRAPLGADELSAVLEALDALELHPQQATHLLRTEPLPELLASARGRERCTYAWPSAHTSVWCSYKKELRDCGCAPAPPDAAGGRAPPRLLSIDCEFSPLRVAAVDAAGALRLDAIAVGASYPGVLGCDAAATPRLEPAELRARVLSLFAPGGTWVAHTPQRDLAALGLTPEALGAAGVALVDVGRLGVPAGAQVASLRRMAEAHLGVTLHAGGRRHCAVEDAAVTMRLYHKLAAAEVAREGAPLLSESVDAS